MITVAASDNQCRIEPSEVPAGTMTLQVRNEGTRVTEVYVLRPDDSIVTERENIGPGTGADVVVELSAGRYRIQCKPGMVGDGISAGLTVTPAAQESRAVGELADPRLRSAVADYRAYVGAQVADSLAGARELAEAIEDDDLATARAHYAPSRVGWERIEPVAESFGDLDPRVDAREADVPAGEPWTGWHRIEKALFARGTTAGMAPVARQLVADLQELSSRVPDALISPTSMANGAKELLDEVATTKVTGEEEAFSHTDLVDIAANVEGARQVVDLLRPVATERDSQLVRRIDLRFATLEETLDQYRAPGVTGGFVRYDTLDQAQRKALSDAVNALAEPLSHLAAAVAGV